MFGIGLGEIAVVLVVALVLIRPKDLPALLRKAGRLWGKLGAMSDKARDVAKKAAREAARDISIEDEKEERE
jgi:sec-independent protein translocase protein TatB